MEKLTPAQETALNQIRDEIAFAQKFDDFKKYYVAHRLKGQEQCSDYDELYDYYTRMFEKDEAEIVEAYKPYWLEKLNNIALTHCSSATLRVLEKKGYIRILEDTANERWGIDKVELLKR